MSPAEISAYGRDVVTRLGGKPAALVTDVNLKALIDAGNALAGVATDIATAQQPGQPIASLQVAWNQALTGWRTAQVALRPRLREFLVGGLPEIPGLSVLASGMDWDRPEGLRGNLTLGPVSLAVDSSALLFPAPFTADSLALGPFRPNTFAASFGGA